MPSNMPMFGGLPGMNGMQQGPLGNGIPNLMGMGGPLNNPFMNMNAMLLAQ